MKKQLVFYFVLILFLSSCGREAVLEKEIYAFGTRIEVILAQADSVAAQEAMDAVLQEFNRLHRSYHAWQPSELTKANEAFQKKEKIILSSELAQLIQTAKQLSAQTHYLFDPGIGGLIELWGFHRDEFQAVLPSKRAIDSFLKAQPSIKDIQINQQTAYSLNSAVALDFGGYLKGWALDRAAKILKEKNIHHALINIGGNILALGNKYGRAWRIGIQHPRMPSPLAVLDLNDGEAIGTSGDYQRYFEINQKRYSHLFNPQTGYPANETQAVSILMEKQENAGMYSDVYSKPIFIAGEHWQEYAQNLNLKYILRVNQQGEIEVTRHLYNRLEFLMDSDKIKIVDF